jgi:hypothetical protein
MSTNAAYAATPRYEIEVHGPNQANLNYDGTGHITTLFTAGPNGSRVDAVGWKGQGDVANAGALCFFFRKSGADPWRFIFCWNYQAVTTSVTTHPPGGGVSNLGIVLTAGAQIGFCLTTNDVFAVHVTQAGDF